MKATIKFGGLTKDEAVVVFENGAQQGVTVLDKSDNNVLFVSVSNKLVKATLVGETLENIAVLRERVYLR